MRWKIVHCLSTLDWADVANSVLWDVILVRLSSVHYLFTALISAVLFLLGEEGRLQIPSWPKTRRRNPWSQDLEAFSSNTAKPVGWHRIVDNTGLLKCEDYWVYGPHPPITVYDTLQACDFISCISFAILHFPFLQVQNVLIFAWGLKA